MPIAFHFDPDKFTQAAAYVTSRCPGSMTKKKLFKLLYLADREHLFRYARPILKDRYVNMDQGPVPSGSYDLLKGNNRKWPQGVIDAFARHINVSGMRVSVREPAPVDLLSMSDISVLDEVVERYGTYSAEHLSAISHRHQAWLKSRRNRHIDYALFFEDSEVENARGLVEHNQPIRNISKNVSLSTQP